jgi:hypothetical protein
MNHSLRPPTAEVIQTLAGLVCWVVLLLFSARSAALEPIVVAEAGPLDYPLRATNLEVYTGEGSRPATIAEIEQLWQSGAFKPVKTLNFGLQPGGIWGRLVVENRQSSHRALVLNHRFAPIDLMDIYFRGPTANGFTNARGTPSSIAPSTLPVPPPSC